MMINKYFLFGLIVCLSTISLKFGTILAFIYALLSLKLTWKGDYKQIIFIIISIKLLWVISVFIGLSSKTIYSLLQFITPDAVLLLMLFISINKDNLDKFLLPFVGLFLIDLSFNLSIVMFGEDFFGRTGGFRPGDWLVRLGGIFDNTMFSIAIATIGVIIGILSRRRWLFILAIIELLINGSQRAPLILIIFTSGYILFKMKSRLILIFGTSFIFAAMVVLATFYTAYQTGYFDNEDVFITGNILRVVAWTNAIDSISLSNILFGNHNDFIQGNIEIPGMSVNTIRDYGIAESRYLQMTLDYGFIPAFLSYYVLYFITKRDIVIYYSDTNNDVYLARALMGFVLFTESFYGVLYGTYIIIFLFAIISLGYEERDVERKMDSAILGLEGIK